MELRDIEYKIKALFDPSLSFESGISLGSEIMSSFDNLYPMTLISIFAMIKKYGSNLTTQIDFLHSEMKEKEKELMAMSRKRDDRDSSAINALLDEIQKLRDKSIKYRDIELRTQALTSYLFDYIISKIQSMRNSTIIIEQLREENEALRNEAESLTTEISLLNSLITNEQILDEEVERSGKSRDELISGITMIRSKNAPLLDDLNCRIKNNSYFIDNISLLVDDSIAKNDNPGYGQK